MFAGDSRWVTRLPFSLVGDLSRTGEGGLWPGDGRGEGHVKGDRLCLAGNKYLKWVLISIRRFTRTDRMLSHGDHCPAAEDQTGSGGRTGREVLQACSFRARRVPWLEGQKGSVDVTVGAGGSDRLKELGFQGQSHGVLSWRSQGPSITPHTLSAGAMVCSAPWTTTGCPARSTCLESAVLPEAPAPGHQTRRCQADTPRVT